MFLAALALLVLVSLFRAETSPPSAVHVERERGMFFVPGLGRADRLTTVVHNVRTLQQASQTHTQTHSLSLPRSGIATLSRLGAHAQLWIAWDCVVYIYAPRTESAFWTRTEELAFLARHCELVENPGKLVTDNLYMMQPALLQATYEYVFLHLDDIKIAQSEDFQLHRMVEILKCNVLTVVSPRIIGANKGGGQQFRSIMQSEAQAGSLGYVSSFVEIFSWVMTMSAYRALWELLCPSVNPYAWGYDFWYNSYAKRDVPGHKMGIASVLSLRHEQDTSAVGAGRTDNTKFEDKWRAVLAQERYYMKFKKIPLAKYRKQLDLSNTSWNGAVQGFLHDCL